MTSKHAILFSAPMVAAIQDGRKTMTRRIIKSSHESGMIRISIAQQEYNNAGYYHGIMPEFLDWDERSVGNIVCPYGKVGDILWVREEHYRYGHWVPVDGVKTATGRQKWMFIEETDEVRYSDNPPAEFKGGRHHKDPPMTSGWYKRLGRFMPYSACRSFLKITGIRVERLQDISEEDAIAEGIINRGPFGFTSSGIDQSETALSAFKYLWESINGYGSWKRNDWVWVVSFKRTDKPE